MVIGGGDLHDISADKVQSPQTAQDLQQFAAGHAAGVRGPRAGCVRGLQDLDIDGYVEGTVPDAISELGGHLVHALVEDVGAGHDAEPEAPIVLEIALAVERPARADMAECLAVDEAFFERPSEWSPVRELSAE